MFNIIQIYCGDGKGKTTAAVGLAIRGAGNDFNVAFAQFLKDDSSGEISILRKIPQIRMFHTNNFYGFVKYMNDEQKAEMKAEYADIIKRVEREIKENTIVVLDEVIHACNFGLLEEKTLCEFLDKYSQRAEIVLTGRNPSKELIKRADYISEIKKVRHPYDKGIEARKGIEL